MKIGKTNIIVFFMATFFYWFSIYTYVPILPTYIKSFGTNYKIVGIILGSYGFAQMLLRIPLGIYSDKVGKRKPFIISGLLFSLMGSIGFYIAVNPFGLLVSRSLTGFAAASWVAFSILFSSYFKREDSQKAIGYIVSVTSLGQVSGMLIGGWLANAYGNKVSFITASIGAIISIILVIFVKEDTSLKVKEVSLKNLYEIFKDKSLIFFSCIAALIQFMTFATVFSFTPIYAARLGATPLDLSLLSILSTAPTIFAATLSGTWLPKILGNKKTLIYGFILSSLTILVIPFTNTFILLVFTQIIGGFARSIIFTMLMGLSIRNIDNEKRATGMGFFQAIYGIGMFTGPWITGIINDFSGLSQGFYFIALLGLIGAFSMTFTFRLNISLNH